MDHEAAIETKAAERYMLAEMPSGEREAFEAHYFGCTICAQDVMTLDAIRGGVSKLPDPQKKVELRPNPRPRPAWFPWVVAAGLMMVVGYQNAVYFPRMTQANAFDVVQQEVMLETDTRAEGAQQHTFPADQTTLLTLDVVHDPQYVSYRSELRRGSKVLGSRPITAARIQSASLSLLLRPLPAGSYEVVIEGVRKEGNRTTITRHPFVVVEAAPGVRAEKAP